MEQIADKEIIKSEDMELTISQEKRIIDDVIRHLTDAQFSLGDCIARFPDLSAMIDQAVLKAHNESIAADDRLNERM